jgi:hypothetical protein
MSEPSTSPVAPPTVSIDALRIVLFGMPDAGKSSLLGALAQSAQTQEHLLNGRLTDLSHGLTELQRRLYENEPRETLEEIVPYPVAFEPFAPPGQPAPERVEAVLVDCDGRVANELLARRRSLDADSREGSLAGAILEADSLLLVVDASASPAQVDADFTEFGRFLRLLEQSRGRRTEVGGLPVFLVLTKCDLLAQVRDSAAVWMERIEDRKRQVDARFREFLARHTAEGPLPFGSINLHLWATAVKRPELAGTPAKPREPYGVAELFRQLLDAGQVFRGRQARAGRRLAWTVGGAGGLLTGMLTLALVLLANRDSARPTALLNQVEAYRSREGQTPSARLREPLQPKISELTDLKNDPGFAALSEKEREYVEGRLQELLDYRQYKQRLQEVRSPADATSEKDLDRIEAALKESAPPAERQTAWAQTEATLLRNQRLEEAKAVRAAVLDLDDWYRRIIRRGEDLWAFAEHRPRDGGPISWRDWHTQVQALLDEAENPPHAPGDRLPGGSRVTYATVFRFDRIAEDRTTWDAARQRLQRLRDLTAALGLAGTLPGRPPLLEIPPPPRFTAEQARGRLQELEKTYPRYQQEFKLTDLPDAALGEIRRAARTSYENAIAAGQEVVLRHLRDVCPEGRETVEGWRRLRPWLASPEDLQAWRVLATLLARLQDPAALDPVTALDVFVAQERFDLDLRRLTLEIPDDLKVRPAGPFALTLRTGGDRIVLEFEQAGDGRRDARRRVTAYAFRPTGADRLTYRPGDRLWAELPLKDETNDEWRFGWARYRSEIYQFERLSNLPRLYRKGQDLNAGKLAEGVVLGVVPEDGLPRVPDLLPVVPSDLGKR